MPDIAMCQNEACPNRQICFRFAAEPNPYRQSYAAFAPAPGDAQCEYFWPLSRATTKLREKPKS
jgi:hypothetical protein